MAGITINVGALDVKTIVDNLIQAESTPLATSQTKLTNYQTQFSTLGKVGSSLSTLQRTLLGLSTGTFTQGIKTHSSDTGIADVNGTATKGMVGNYQLEVKSIAQPKQLVFDLNPNGSSITDTNTVLQGLSNRITLSLQGQNHTVNLTSEMSLKDLAEAINTQVSGVQASIVKSGSTYKLVLAASTSGSENSFSLTGNDSNITLAGLGQSESAKNESKEAQDATFTVNGVSVTSGSNRISNVIPGADITLYRPGLTTITLSQDNDAAVNSVQNFVDAYNQVLSNINNARATAKQSSLSLLSITQQLNEILTTALPSADTPTTFTYLAQIGITLQKDGSLQLQTAAFTQALQKDPDAVKGLFSNNNQDGVAQKLQQRITFLLGPEGIVETGKSSLQNRINNEETIYNNLLRKLELRRVALTQQFSALNMMLTAMQENAKSLGDMIDNTRK